MTINELEEKLRKIAEYLGCNEGELVSEVKSLITENYQPKTTSTDMGEVKQSFEHSFHHYVWDSDEKRIILYDIQDNKWEGKWRDVIWDFFLPHLSNKPTSTDIEEVKKAVRKGLKGYQEKIFYRDKGLFPIMRKYRIFDRSVLLPDGKNGADLWNELSNISRITFDWKAFYKKMNKAPHLSNKSELEKEEEEK